MNARVWKYPVIIASALSMVLLAEADDRGGMKRGNDKSREQHREKYDADGDGTLSREERKAMPEGLRNNKPGNRQSWEQHREKYDADGDGTLSREEREAMPEGLRNKRPGNRQSWEQHREKYDTDGDGTLSKEEREAMPDGLKKQMRPRQGDPKPPETDA